MYLFSKRRFRTGLCRRPAILTLAAVSLVLATSPSLFAATYYVSPSGNDSNDGSSISTPWQTLDRVNGFSFQPGDKILFKAGGVWNGQLEPSVSGISGKPIVVNMYTRGAKPIINGDGSNGSAAVEVNDQSYWEFNNLEVTNKQLSGGTSQLFGFHIIGSATHIYVLNCLITNVQSAPVGASNYSKDSGGIIFDNGTFTDIKVADNTLSNVATTGIRDWSSHVTGFVIQNNMIEDVYGDGIVLAGVLSGSPSVAQNNTLYNVCESSAGYYAGLWTVYSHAPVIIEQNEIYGLKGGGGDGEPFDSDVDTSNSVFEYNYTHDNSRGFILLMADTASHGGAHHVTVRYNISENDALNGNTYLIHQQSGGDVTNQFYNNVFYVSKQISEVILNATTLTFNNNILYFTVAPARFSNIAFGSSSIFENNDFYPASIISHNGPGGTVSGNITSDPKFVSPGRGGTGVHWNPHTGFATSQNGYKLLGNSPALGAGVVMNNNGGYDYWGNSVSSTAAPNIGAYNGGGNGRGGDDLPTGVPLQVISKRSGLCMDVQGNSQQDGAKIDQNRCNGQSYQNWILTSLGGGAYTMEAQSSQQVLDDPAWSATATTYLDQFGPNGGANQSWIITSIGSGYYKIVNQYSNLCMDVYGNSTRTGALIDQYTCNGQDNQAWSLTN